MMSGGDRDFDLVVYGATGFTGGLVCDYLASKASGAFRWAIAGRSAKKLEDVRRRVQEQGHKVEIIVASKEEAGEWTHRTRVVLSTAGPFMLYGRELVAACVESATSYVDITGELPFVKDNIEAYQERARERGIHIISCCGFDSIPSDVTTFCAVQKLQEMGVTNVDSVDVEQSAQGGSVSGGTLASMFNMMETPKLLSESSAPYYLNAGEKGAPVADPKFVSSSPIGGYRYPFVMAMVNSRIVRRTESLRHQYALKPYNSKNEFRFTEYARSEGVVEALLVTCIVPIFMVLCFFSFTRRLLTTYVLPAPGQGPSAKRRAEARFQTLAIASGRDAQGKQHVAKVRMSGGDPGYAETAKMISEAALCLLESGNDLKDRAGVITPGLLGEPLVKRLRNAGLEIKHL